VDVSLWDSNNVQLSLKEPADFRRLKGSVLIGKALSNPPATPPQIQNSSHNLRGEFNGRAIPRVCAGALTVT